ncbi:MAG: hypothetical protein ABIQ86_08895 [Steroidobacteraceae bacterium]
MKKSAVLIAFACLSYLANAGAREASVQSIVRSPREGCNADEYSDADPSTLIQQCLLARPIRDAEKHRALNGVRENNRFLDAVLRQEVKDAIKRGANAYLAAHRAEQHSFDADNLYRALSAEFSASVDANDSEDIFLLLLVFIEKTYHFEGVRRGPVSGLEKSGRGQGIYTLKALQRLVLYEYASHVTGSKSLGTEARKSLRVQSENVSPPKTNLAKGCGKRITHTWPTVSAPVESYSDTSEEPDGTQRVVHWGICPDDQSLWVYHYKFGWKKASINDVAAVCGKLEDFAHMAVACVGSR